MGAVIGSPVRSSSRPRGVWRWLPRGGGALLASAAVHAIAAVTVGGALAYTTRGNHQDDMVEIELAPSPDIAANLPAPAPASAPPASRPAGPVRAHPAPRQRVAMRPTVTASVAASPAVPVAPIDAPADAPRFVMSAGTVATRATLPASVATGSAGLTGSAGSADPSGTGAAAAFGEGDVNVPARLLAPSPLVYPAAARAAGIEIDFPIEIVVDPSGRVVSARALRHAGYGLDEAALRAIRGYRFSPALRAGRTVPVRMHWNVQFRLR